MNIDTEKWVSFKTVAEKNDFIKENPGTRLLFVCCYDHIFYFLLEKERPMSISKIFDGLDFQQTKTLRVLFMDDLQQFLKDQDESSWLSVIESMAPGLIMSGWNIEADMRTHRRALVEESHAKKAI